MGVERTHPTLWLLIMALVTVSNNAIIETAMDLPEEGIDQAEYLISLFNQDRNARSLGQIYLD